RAGRAWRSEGRRVELRLRILWLHACDVSRGAGGLPERPLVVEPGRPILRERPLRPCPGLGAIVPRAPRSPPLVPALRLRRPQAEPRASRGRILGRPPESQPSDSRGRTRGGSGTVPDRGARLIDVREALDEIQARPADEADGR